LSAGVPEAVADAIVVAAGASRRMGGTDKLGWSLGGQPLLAHTLAGLAACPEIDSLVLVTAAERHAELTGAPWLPRIVREVVLGGARRQDSVRAGFEALERLVPDPDGARVVLVHDGARPVVSPSLVTSVVAATIEFGAAIPVAPIVETVKRVEHELVLETLDRATLATAQTPQGVRRAIFREALARIEAGEIAASEGWTDEAALLAACRIPIRAVPGDPLNLKVTVPSDLLRVAQLLEIEPDASSTRTGIGHDSHPFGPGEPLWLGGIEFPGVPRLHGHSDGDAALHAIADALLGAAGAGDLGRLFPADDSTPVGIASGRLLRAAVERIAQADWHPAGVDLVIIAARPRLADRLDAMRARIAELCGLAPEAVSVKASTGNLDGSDGAGRSVSALAVVTVMRA